MAALFPLHSVLFHKSDKLVTVLYCTDRDFMSIFRLSFLMNCIQFCEHLISLEFSINPTNAQTTAVRCIPSQVLGAATRQV